MEFLRGGKVLTRYEIIKTCDVAVMSLKFAKHVFSTMSSVVSSAVDVQRVFESETGLESFDYIQDQCKGQQPRRMRHDEKNTLMPAV